MRPIIYLPALITFLLLALIAPRIRAQEPLTIGKTVLIHSAILREDRQLFISLPGSFSDTYFYKRRYPVVYLLDAEAHFYNTASMIRQMSGENGGTDFPEMIIVGILNTDRNRDLTPTRDQPAGMDSASASHSGGGEQFFQFLSGELIPYIDSAYATAPYRIFAGHSLGGLTVINTLIHHPGVFQAYIAGDPSMSWDNQRLLREAKTVLGKGQWDKTSLYLAIANSMRDKLPVSLFGADTMMTRLSRIHHQCINTLRDYCQATPSLRFSSKYYPEYDHSTLPPVSWYDGLRFLFSYYKLDLPMRAFFQPSFSADTLIAVHYNEISRRMGYTVAPPEPFINFMGYNLLQSRQFARARYFFALNISNYPNSFNVYDSMGDYYLATSDEAHAITSFRQSLTLRENPQTREKLKKLEKGE